VAMAVLSDETVIQLFEDDCHVRGLSEHTIVSYLSTLTLFSRWIKGRGYELLSVDKEILKEYIAFLRSRDVHQKTIENRFSTFSSLYDFAVFEDLVEKNIVKEIRKRYLKPYKENNGGTGQRKIIGVEEMSRFITSIVDLRDKAIVLLFAKTGIRRRELVSIDLGDICWDDMSIMLKPTHKRSNRVVFFDYECMLVLRKWLAKRELLATPGNRALFVSYIDRKARLNRNGVGYIFVKWAERAGLHDACSERLEDHFTAHCCRHWFTTVLRRAGMPREFIQELRGDKRRDAIDIYDHIDREELRKSYLAHIPQLGIC
jgi:integrase/recombinase XerD